MTIYPFNGHEDMDETLSDATRLFTPHASRGQMQEPNANLLLLGMLGFLAYDFTRRVQKRSLFVRVKDCVLATGVCLLLCGLIAL